MIKQRPLALLMALLLPGVASAATVNTSLLGETANLSDSQTTGPYSTTDIPGLRSLGTDVGESDSNRVNTAFYIDPTSQIAGHDTLVRAAAGERAFAQVSFTVIYDFIASGSGQVTSDFHVFHAFEALSDAYVPRDLLGFTIGTGISTPSAARASGYVSSVDPNPAFDQPTGDLSNHLDVELDVFDGEEVSVYVTYHAHFGRADEADAFFSLFAGMESEWFIQAGEGLTLDPVDIADVPLPASLPMLLSLVLGAAGVLRVRNRQRIAVTV